MNYASQVHMVYNEIHRKGSGEETITSIPISGTFVSEIGNACLKLFVVILQDLHLCWCITLYQHTNFQFVTERQ